MFLNVIYKITELQICVVIIRYLRGVNTAGASTVNI